MRVSVYPHDFSKIAAARITKLDIEIFHHKSWKPIYFWFKWSKVTRRKNSAGVGFLHSCECWLLLVLCKFFVHYLPYSLGLPWQIYWPRQQVHISIHVTLPAIFNRGAFVTSTGWVHSYCLLVCSLLPTTVVARV